MTRKVEANLMREDVTLRQVMQRLNEGVFGVIFMVDRDDRVLGMLTDGDVRRALLAGAELDHAAAPAMNRSFVVGRSSAPHADNIALLSDRIRHVPVLDEAGRLVDLLSWAEMLRIPLMEPSLGGNELKNVSDCITSGWISSQGDYVRRFEAQFADFLAGVQSVAVSSGTAALHLALKAVGVGPGDEVIVPDLTFAAVANVVIHCGAIPILADVDAETWTLDAREVAGKITERTRAVIPVHLYGHPCQMDDLRDLAEQHRLWIIEDCAEAQGALFRDKQVGTIGHVGCFSFFSNKVITTGEGGMVTTSDPDIADRVRVLRDHGMRPGKRYWHDVAGFNYRMTNLQAAVGVAQMERVDEFLLRRQEIGERYIDQLGKLPGLVMPPRQPWARTIFWIFSMLVDSDKAGSTRDELCTQLQQCGIETRPLFHPLHEQPPYKSTGRFPVASRLSAQGISLPSGNEISDAEIDRVCSEVSRILTGNR
jgi:perosamine synthetase